MPDRTASSLDQKIADAFRSACEAELNALKPGNVHIFAPGHDMDIDHFRTAADAAAPHISNPHLRVGARIRSAVDASMTAAGCNTNLGIILLCAPIAAAKDQELSETTPRDRLAKILGDLNATDAEDVFAAIRRAHPGGLGDAARLDVHGPEPAVDLLAAMRLSADYDRIAKAYITDFEDIFCHHFPALQKAVESQGAQTVSNPAVLTMLHMQMLQDFPDSHIGRKFGPEAAHRVQRQAADLRSVWHPDQAGPGLPDAHPKLLSFDQDLKNDRLNPGTTADFVVATLFAACLFRPFDAHQSPKAPCPGAPSRAI